MNGVPVHIVLVEPSRVVSLGLKAMTDETGGRFSLLRVDDLHDVQLYLARNRVDLVLANPSTVMAEPALFRAMRSEYPDIPWLAFVYAFFDPRLLARFSGVVSILDPPGEILNHIRQALEASREVPEETGQEVLSDREKEVLRLLVSGFQAKEIAEQLSISTHTVTTHRKNISQKTGIRSISGLTLFAVVQGIITVDDYPGGSLTPQ